MQFKKWIKNKEEGESLYLDMVRHPDDINRISVFADWLEENGEESYEVFRELIKAKKNKRNEVFYVVSLFYFTKKLELFDRVVHEFYHPYYSFNDFIAPVNCHVLSCLLHNKKSRDMTFKIMKCEGRDEDFRYFLEGYIQYQNLPNYDITLVINRNLEIEEGSEVGHDWSVDWSVYDDIKALLHEYQSVRMRKYWY